MAGYTPAFSDIYTGTLYGRWPAAAVWASLLPLLDKNGHIDMSMQAIAGMTGWPIDLLAKGIGQLMEPDPHSRTPDHEGRRLVPLDESRPWGWRAVNHAKYREKARLQGKNAREVEAGKNKERMDRRRPPLTAADPLSDADADTYADKKKNRAKRSVPEDFSITPEMRRWADEHVPTVDIDAATSQFVDDRRSKNVTYTDPVLGWRTWMRNCVQYGRPLKPVSVQRERL